MIFLVLAGVLLLVWAATFMIVAYTMSHKIRLATASLPCDFPANPQLGDEFTCPSCNKQYVWDGNPPAWMDMGEGF